MAEDLGSMIEKAMADPRFGEIFGMLKQKADSGELDVSKVSSLLGGNGEDGSVQASETLSSAESGNDGRSSESSGAIDVISRMPDLSGLLGRKGGKRDFAKHEKLLCALKPYLSDNKKNAVDTVVQAAKLGDILEVFGGASKAPPPTKNG